MNANDQAFTVKAATNHFCEWYRGKELIVDKQNRYNGEQLNRESRSFAQALKNLGINKGDKVALMGVASCRFYAAYFAVHKLGGVTCNIHVRESAEYISRTLEKIDARVVICSEHLLATATAGAALCAQDIPVVSLADTPGEGALLAYGDIISRFPPQEPEVEISPEDTAVIILSSGSTGTPKGVVHSNGNFVRWMHAAPELFGAVNRYTRFLVIVATSFAAWPYSSIPVLFAGGTIVLVDGFTPESFCEAAEKEKITMAGPVPTMIRMLEPEITDRYDLSSFEMMLCAGEPPSDGDIERVLTWADTDIRCLYLASESAPGVATYWELKDLQLNGKRVCAGRPIPGADIRIVDPDGSIDDEVESGQEGEIILSGPTISTGYLGNEELTKQRFINGWWRSGDLGHLDKEGYLYIEGRTDNQINTGGIKVQGEEVEACLIGHPAVSQAAVIGVPDPKWGQSIEAHVVCNAEASEIELGEHCKEQGLASFKQPKKYVFHQSLPLGITGKLDRVTLRKQSGGAAGDPPAPVG
jgi:acyl-CoA synthetase (AMP-forming)/AMP-acid ligase II